MIVREVAKNIKLLDDFDWFNDYKDTRRWLEFSYPELLVYFDRAYEEHKEGES